MCLNHIVNQQRIKAVGSKTADKAAVNLMSRTWTVRTRVRVGCTCATERVIAPGVLNTKWHGADHHIGGERTGDIIIIYPSIIMNINEGARVFLVMSVSCTN